MGHEFLPSLPPRQHLRWRALPSAFVVRSRTLAVLLVLCGYAPQLSAQLSPERLAVGQPSLADSVLTADVWGMIQIWEMAGDGPADCTETPRLGARVIAEVPKKKGKGLGPWVEHWTVHRCEAQVAYRVAFTPEQSGTAFQVALLQP